MNTNSPKSLSAVNISPQVITALVTVYVVWGSTYLAIRIGVETLPPLLLGAIRFLVSGGIFYAWLRLKGEPTPTKREWRSATVIGALLLVGGNGVVVWAEKTVSSGLAALMVSVVPLWMVVFDWLRPNGVRPTLVVVIGLLLGFFGLVLLVGPDSLHSSFSLTPGMMALIIAPISWGYGSVYSRQAPLPKSPFMSTAIEMLMGGFLLLSTSLFLGELDGFSFATVSRTGWLSLLYLIFIGALVGFTAYIWLLHNAPLPITSTYAYVNPVVAVFLGWLILDETISHKGLVGAGIILVSVAIVTAASWKKKEAQATP